MRRTQVPEDDEGVRRGDTAVQRWQAGNKSSAGDGHSVLGAEEGLGADSQAAQPMTRAERKAFEGALKTILKPHPSKNRGRKKRRKKGR